MATKRRSLAAAVLQPSPSQLALQHVRSVQAVEAVCANNTFLPRPWRLICNAYCIQETEALDVGFKCLGQRVEFTLKAALTSEPCMKIQVQQAKALLHAELLL
mmetsp:Transcript_53300/g.105997  ORF Transcript_53300/g.105997 Transcript_53300/m.105997 type:complete len:103 (-) Transcript_53300:1145-1453(-)